MSTFSPERIAGPATPRTMRWTTQPNRMWPVTATSSRTASDRPSPLGETTALVSVAAVIRGGTLSVMNLAFRTAYSSGRVPS